MESLRTASELVSLNLPALGQKVVFDIPITADLESLDINFYGTFTLGAGATSVITDGMLNLITSCELKGDGGRTTIVSMPFNSLVQSNMWRAKKGSEAAVVQPNITAGAQTYNIAASLDLSAYAAMRAKDSSLRESAYSDLKLEFRFAPDFTVVYAGAGAVTVPVFNLSAIANETVELVSISGETSNPTVRVLNTAADLVVAGATSKLQYRLTNGVGLRGLALRVQSTANPPVLSDNILLSARIIVGKTVRRDISGAALKAKMAKENPVTPPTGYYFFDFTEFSGSVDQLSNLIDTSAASTGGADCFLEVATNAAATITIIQYGYVPLTVA